MNPEIKTGQIWVRRPSKNLHENHHYEKVIIGMLSESGRYVHITHLRDNFPRMISKESFLEEYFPKPDAVKIWKSLNQEKEKKKGRLKADLLKPKF